MSERELTPDEEAEISRLLADAASPEPMPAEVSGRLDDVLAGLVAEREAAAPVVPLRARRWPQLLVAAAAVSLVGFVGANFLQQRGGEADMSSAGSPAEVANGDDGQSYDDRSAEGGGQAPTVPQDTAAPGPTPLPEVAAADPLFGYGDLDMMLLRSTRELPGWASAFAAGKCTRPAMKADAYEVTVSAARRAVVLVKPVNKRAAAVYVYPCGQSVVPVAASLVLGIR